MCFRYATGIRSYLKSVLSYKLLFLGTFLSDVLHLHEQERKNPCLYFEAKRGPRAKRNGEHSATSYTAKHCLWFRTLYEFPPNNNTCLYRLAARVSEFLFLGTWTTYTDLMPHSSTDQKYREVIHFLDQVHFSAIYKEIYVYQQHFRQRTLDTMPWFEYKFTLCILLPDDLWLLRCLVTKDEVHG